MKKSIFIVASALLIAGSTFTACDSPKENLENAQDKATTANGDLDKANEAYLADIENYRKQSNERIAANDKKIADLKLEIAHEKAATKAAYNTKLEAMELKSQEMKKRMDEYKADGKDKWEAFKTEFNHDMDGLGDAFKDITVKNTK